MIKLLSTDFDGTLVNHFEKPAVVPELFRLFEGLREKGVFWAVNTGRVVWHIAEGLEEFGFPFQPDFILTSERHIYRPAKNGTDWEDFGSWNVRCEEDHRVLYSEARSVFDAISSFVEKKTKAQMIFEDDMPMGLVTSSEEEMDHVCKFIEKARRGAPKFHYQRNTQYLRFCHADYSKGTALGELARLIGVERDEIFAAGDHFNDIPMLDGQHARWVACPSNSADAVKETVLAADGYVAQGSCSQGIVEALRYYGVS